MKKLLERIQDYWGDRAEAFAEYNSEQLSDKWAEVFEKELSGLKPGAKILDVGCGPAFFSVILSKMGYDVTGIDCTEEMLNAAKEHARIENCDITFLDMKADALEFPDGEFDAVVSRYVTWTLEDPEKAYREWTRVLKKDGVLVNFDANWYNYLFDEEKRRGYEQDRLNVQKAQMYDQITDTNVAEMESIASQLPLSKITRPEWDMEVFDRIGSCDTRVDWSVCDKVWTDEDKINNASTPMFMLIAKKR